MTSASYGGAQCWKIAAWDDGTTEGGSSGSGLWDQNGLLVGQLYGGQASCSFNVNDYYGKFNVSFPLLQQWLGDCGTTLPGLDPATVSVPELDEAAGIGLAPNPTTGTVLVSLPALGDGTAVLRVTDALGRVVVERTVARGTERLTLDLAGQADGLYLVDLRQNDRRVVQRLLLER